MSAAEQQDDKESQDGQKIEGDDKTDTEKNEINENAEEWDGKERRSEDRPWSEGDKKTSDDEEVLSKEERDALSENVEQLTDDAGVITYDFYSPAHINKSSLPALAIINEKIIESLNESLINLLQREVEVSANDVDINRYGDFIHSLPTLVDTSVINVSKIDAQVLVCIDGALIEIIMDAYFGGEGKLSEESDKQVFTGTELNMSNKILEMFLTSNKYAWEKIDNFIYGKVEFSKNGI